MSVASQSLMDNVTYEDLYTRWEHGNWSAYDLDFSKDKAGWEALSEIQKRSAMWIYSMFFYGEDRVADTLAPYVTAAPTEEQSYFLATQQVDEVRHSVFFHRFFKEVIGVGGETLQQTLSSTLPQLDQSAQRIDDRAHGRSTHPGQLEKGAGVPSAAKDGHLLPSRSPALKSGPDAAQVGLQPGQEPAQGLAGLLEVSD